MLAEESLRSKALYKLFLATIKYIPMVISSCYVLNTALALAGIDVPILSMLSGMSFFTWIFMYLAAVVFRFCAYHRMFLWFILGEDAVNTVDYHFDLPVSDLEIFAIHFSMIGIFLFIILYLYVKSNKKSTAKSHRRHRYR